MISWNVAYNRLQQDRDFLRYFPGGVDEKNNPTALRADSFRSIKYVKNFTVAALATVGPAQQNFPAGAIILDIDAAAFQPQTTNGAYTYAPSFDPQRRDLFRIGLQYTNDELITPGGPGVAASILTPSFPSKELLIPPSQGILITLVSLVPAGNPDLTVSVTFDCCVPRMVG
jgi:hypothetical protein